MSLSEPSEAQRTRLRSFEALLRDPGVARGMVSRRDAERLHDRHVRDSLRGLRVRPSVIDRAVDVGSGGGLPGIPLAIVRRDVRFVLAERRTNRADFLRLVIRELDLANVEIHEGDVSTLGPGTFDVATARAFADARTTWAVVEPLLRSGGQLIYWAGSSFDLGRDLPPGVRYERCEAPEVAGSGPLVIMTRQ